jgi:hypothetical protein
VATFVCRCFVYLAGMVELIYARSRVAIMAIKTGAERSTKPWEIQRKSKGNPWKYGF